MTEETMCCPKCNGSGQVKKTRFRSKTVRSEDPSKKWCYKCQQFKVLAEFYVKTNYCKSCHCLKSKLIPKKFRITCIVCFAKFATRSRNNVFCSGNCVAQRRKSTRQLREQELLPSYLTEDFKG